MSTRIREIPRLILVIVIILLPGSAWIPDASGAGLDERVRIETGVVERQAEIDGAAEEEEQPIMTIGYTPRQYRSNPLLRGHTAVQSQVTPTQFNPGNVINGILLVLFVLLCLLVVGILGALFS